MCNQDNSDAFGAPRGGAVGSALSQLRPGARGGLSGTIASARGPAPAIPVAPAAPVVQTGLASVTPAARGPRNRRGLER